MLRIGSLFTGTGQLDAAVEQTLGAETIWRSDIKPAAVRLIEHYWPGTNLGDITAIDWTRVAPVDVITGGYPCQSFSLAGNRSGTDDSRYLWRHIADAIAEFMMGWPAGWTDIPGLSRADRLSLCGDGVVPQQCAEALRRLLPVAFGLGGVA